MKNLTTILFLISFSPSLVFAQSANQSNPQNVTRGTGQNTSIADLQKIIQDLVKQVQALQQQVSALQGELGKQLEPAEPKEEKLTTAPITETATSEPTPPELNRSLSRGSSGDDVRKLQEFLSKDKDIYPDGLITGFFGPLTESAVKRWQEKHNIESVGVIGPKTIAKFQELGRGVIQGLIDQGVGLSGVVPPGIQGKLGITATTTIQTATIIPSQASTTAQATTTPSGTTPAIPAIPAQPSPGTGGLTIPAEPATPAVPAATSTTATSTDTVAPSVPTNLVASAVSTSQINLSWSDSTDNVGVVGYKVYRGGTQIATAVALATSTTVVLASYSDTGLQASTTYTYAVAAYDAAGNTSAQSASASATTNPPPPPVSTIPDAPTISSITPHAPIALNQFLISSITLQWNAVTNPTFYLTFYRVYRKFGGGEWLLVGDTQQTSFFDLNIGRGTYSYHVNACDSYGCSPDSNIVTATLTGGGGSDTTPPSTPTNLKAWPDPYNRNFMSWTVSTDNVGVAGYNIYRNGTYLKSVCCTPAEDGFLFSSSTTYSYAVAAYDAAGNESAQSSSVLPAPLSLGAPPSSSAASSLASILESLSLTLQKLLLIH